MKQLCFLFIFSLCVVGPSPLLGASQDDSCSSALRLEVLGKVREIQTSLIVIGLLEREKSPDAKLFLERQIKSSLTVLKSLKTVAKNLSPDDVSKVNESIEESEKYLSERKEKKNENPQ